MPQGDSAICFYNGALGDSCLFSEIEPDCL